MTSAVTNKSLRFLQFHSWVRKESSKLCRRKTVLKFSRPFYCYMNFWYLVCQNIPFFSCVVGMTKMWLLEVILNLIWICWSVVVTGRNSYLLRILILGTSDNIFKNTSHWLLALWENHVKISNKYAMSASVSCANAIVKPRSFYLDFLKLILTN